MSNKMIIQQNMQAYSVIAFDANQFHTTRMPSLLKGAFA